MSTALRNMRTKAVHLAFEGRYAVKTSGRTDLDAYGLDADDRVYYIPSNWLTLRRVLRRHDIRPDDVFIDLGSGKGRMVLEAARYPFRRVIGVELAQPLHEVAMENIRSARMPRSCHDIELVCADALAYPIPDDVTFVFLNNPFRGTVFATVIEKLIASYDRAPRKLKIIYDNPAEHDALMRTGRFIREKTVRRRSARKQGGVFGTTSLYTLTPAADPRGRDD